MSETRAQREMFDGKTRGKKSLETVPLKCREVPSSGKMINL
jgi:hypothetical protein